MRLVSFTTSAVGTRFGVVVGGDAVIDATDLLPGLSSVRDVLQAGALERLAAAVTGVEPTLTLDALELLPPVPDPAKIVCIGVNYRTHREESQSDLPPDPTHPTVFTRFPDSVSGHGAPILSPTPQLDFEGEIAAVIGTAARHLTRDNALAAVAGYGAFNDLSVRDWQRHSSQWSPGKNYHGVGSFGPWLTTADEYPDHDAIALTTRVNGIQRQHTTLGEALFGLIDLLVYVTTFTPLAPGDVLVTGTPGGVGVGVVPPVYLGPGDTVEVEVTGAGTLSNTVKQGW